MCSLSNYARPPAHTLSFDGSNKEGCDNSPVGSAGSGQVKGKSEFDQDLRNRNWVNSQEKR